MTARRLIRRAALFVARRRRPLSLCGVGLTAVLLGAWAVLLVGCPGQSEPLTPTPDVRPTRQTRNTPPPTPGDPWQPAGDNLLMRVRLVSGTDRLTVAVNGPYRVLVDDRERAGSSDPMPEVTLAMAGAGRWTLGGTELTGRRVEILPLRASTLRLGGRLYPGFLRVVADASAQLAGINVVHVEDYVAGVVTSEMPSRFGRSALEAQAIVARTYALFERMTHRAQEWDLEDSENSQVYRGLIGATEAGGIGATVTRQTRGLVLEWGLPGEPTRIFPTFYHSTCGGWTVSVRFVKPKIAPVPPLEGGVKCDWCSGTKYRDRAADAPVRVLKSEFWPRLLKAEPAVAALGGPAATRVAPGQASYGGRLVTVLMTGGGRTVTMRADDFRRAVGARVMLSTLVRLSDDGRNIVLSDGHGWGHGMGLCQAGADGMARAGSSCRDILRFYYPGAVLKKLYD
ncbi:MAG: hypothetical protein BIFFINMI_02631 [Phycisphaerae bacterium]|nr:hypothetical protein [Phycisphaerae bacterium]